MKVMFPGIKTGNLKTYMQIKEWKQCDIFGNEVLVKLRYLFFSRKGNKVTLFSPTRPHWAELVIESPCPSVCGSVCVSVPSRNTHFRRSCRPLVEDRVPNIGLG